MTKIAKNAKNNAAQSLEAQLQAMREKLAARGVAAAEPAPKKKAPIVEAPVEKAVKKKPAIVETTAPKAGKKKLAEIPEETPAPKRGRPKGSKNKPKIVEELAPVAPVTMKVGKKKQTIVEPEAPAPVAKPKKAKNSGPWSLREDNKVAHNGRVLQAERAAHYPTADGGAVWIVGRTVDNRAVFHATGIDGAGNALTPATFAGSPEIVCVILNAYCATLGAAE